MEAPTLPKPSARLAGIYATLPPEAQQAFVFKQLLPLLDRVHPSRAEKILASASRAQAQAARAPVPNLATKRTELDGLINDIERHTKRLQGRGQDRSTASTRDELYTELGLSFSDWLGDIWRLVYEGRTEFSTSHACLLYCVQAMTKLAKAQHICKCTFMHMYLPLNFQNIDGKVVKRFRLDGAHQLERVFLWIWRDAFLTMLASGRARPIKAIPGMLGDIELALGWEALERLLYGGKTYYQGDGEEAEDDEDDEEWEDDPEFHNEEDDCCTCSYHAPHWPANINIQVRVLRQLVVDHLLPLFLKQPSLRLYNTLLHLARNHRAMEQDLRSKISEMAAIGPGPLAVALDIFALQSDKAMTLKVLTEHSYLLRPRDAPSLQASVILLSGGGTTVAFALETLERELRASVSDIRHALHVCYPSIETPKFVRELASVLRLGAGTAERHDRIDHWVDDVGAPQEGAAQGFGDAIAMAAMMMGIPIPAATAADIDDTGGAADFDSSDPDVDDIREEVRPRLGERFNTWIETAQDISRSRTQAILKRTYEEILQTMPYVVAADVVAELSSRILDRPSKHHVGEGLEEVVNFVKSQKRRIQAEADKKARKARNARTRGMPKGFGAATSPRPPTTAGGGLDDVD